MQKWLLLLVMLAGMAGAQLVLDNSTGTITPLRIAGAVYSDLAEVTTAENIDDATDITIKHMNLSLTPVK